MSPSKAPASKANLRAFDAQFGMRLCGIDEVGRGPLAGPVVTACVFIPEEHLSHAVWREVNDSKKLTHNKRDYLFDLIRERCVYAVAEASVEEVDSLNIHHATLLAMKRACESVQAKTEISLALIDGKFAPKIACQTRTVVKGDATSLSIAAASILAKVTRDRYMAKLHEEFPHYGWAANAGYGTPEHMEGIRLHGITPHHRRSFAPCREALEEAA
jgi:ribonuclease HII